MKPSMRPLDEQDRVVLAQLDPGDTVTPAGLKKLFRRFTDVRQPATLKHRVKDLTTQPVFERIGYRQWRFKGLEEDA